MTEAMVNMVEGNPGAITVLVKLMEDPLGLITLASLDDRMIYGADIWIAYKDICGQDIEAFKRKVADRSNDLEKRIDRIRNPR